MLLVPHILIIILYERCEFDPKGGMLEERMRYSKEATIKSEA